MRVLIVGCFVAAGLLATPAVAHACSCDVGSPSVAFQASDVVFVGTVARIDRPALVTQQHPDGSIGAGSPGGPSFATFDVLRVFRGRSERQFVMTLDETSCGKPFKTGQVWLVYALERDGTIRTKECAPTRLRDEAAQDLEYLEGRASQRPQGTVFGLVVRRGVGPDGKAALKNPMQALDVVAVSGGRRFLAKSTNGGEFALALPPGEYELFVEREGKPLSSMQGVRIEADVDRRLLLIASD